MSEASKPVDSFAKWQNLRKQLQGFDEFASVFELEAQADTPKAAEVWTNQAPLWVTLEQHILELPMGTLVDIPLRGGIYRVKSPCSVLIEAEARGNYDGLREVCLKERDQTYQGFIQTVNQIDRSVQRGELTTDFVERKSEEQNK